MVDIMTNMAIPELAKKIMASQPVAIPVFHEVAIKLLQMMKSNSYRVEEVIILVHDDPALASEMLKHANSVYYSGKTPIATIKNAIIRLGTQQVVNIAFSASMASTESDNPVINTLMKNLWHHCHSIAKIGAYLALKISHDKHMADLNHDEVYLAGLFHDIGKLYSLKVIDSLMTDDKIHPDDQSIVNMLDELNVEQGIKILKHHNMPEIYTDLLNRISVDNWKSGSNDHFVATVRLADKMLYCIEHSIDIADSPDTCNIGDELSFLDITDVAELQSFVKAIID